MFAREFCRRQLSAARPGRKRWIGGVGGGRGADSERIFVQGAGVLARQCAELASSQSMERVADGTTGPAPGHDSVEDVVIIGSGPAAHTAAIYAGRAELQPLMYEGFLAGGTAAGGQLTTTTDVENFPGFPDGINGTELTDRFRQQSVRCGTRIVTETVTALDCSSHPFVIRTENGSVSKAWSIILATGATAKRLDIKGTKDGEYWQRGVSACAVCDGAAPIFRNKPLAVIGGGDTAMEEALFLTKYGSSVLVVHRRDELRASMVMQARAKSNPKVHFLYSHVVVAADGDGKRLCSITVSDLKSGRQRQIECSGLFFAIGHLPNTGLVKGLVDMDDEGYIIPRANSTTTNVRGLFACGDCQDKKWRQAVTAAGSGCQAALEVEHYLGERAHEQATAAVKAPKNTSVESFKTGNIPVTTLSM